MDNSITEDRLLTQNENLAILLEISRKMTGRKQTGTLAQIIVDGICELTHMGSAAIYLLEADQLHLEATCPPLPSDFPKIFRIADIKDHPHIHQTITSNQPVSIEDSQKVQLTNAEREVCELRNLRSLLYTPLINQGKAIGVLILCSAGDVHSFTADTIHLCQTLAAHAALALSEARLTEKQEIYIREIEDKNRRLAEAEKAARESEKRVADILQYAENVAFITTDDHAQIPHIIDFSPGAEEIFYYQRDELLGKPIEFLLAPQEKHKLERHLQLIFSQKKSLSAEAVLVRKGGELFTALVKAHPLEDEYGKVWGAFTVSIDISDRKKAEEELQRSLATYRKGLEGMVQSMGILMGKRDNYTAEHQLRVAQLAVAIANKMGLSGAKMEGLRLAAEIHDLGKISIPTQILNKPGKLHELEFKILQTHPRAGYDILHNLDFPWPLAQIIDQHHEKVDGSGYPGGLAGDNILLEARIICVADVVEAMTAHRPYRPAHELKIALEEIATNRGRLYDQDVVDACLKLFQEEDFTFA